MSKTKYRFSYDEIRVIVIALVELKNQLIAEGRYTTHDYEIEVSGNKYHNVLLDVLDGQIRIHVPSTYRGGANAKWFRKIDYYYRPVVDK